MAVDLGSTNFRVCSVNLRGDTTYSSKQLKTPNPRKIMIASLATELFLFIAKQIEASLEAYHSEHNVQISGSIHKEHTRHQQPLLGPAFASSFPTYQTGVGSGTLLHWTKNFDVTDASARTQTLLP